MIDRRAAARRAIMSVILACNHVELMVAFDPLPSDDELIIALGNISAPVDGLVQDLQELGIDVKVSTTIEYRAE